MSAQLAFLTVGVLHEPVGHDRVRGFMERVPLVYAAADASSGFRARSIRDLTTWKQSWGEVVPPACYPQLVEPDRYAMTLSLWDDLESVAAFAYYGPHGEALTRRKEWFESRGLPVYVAWWVPERHVPDWEEGAERLDHLHSHGPSAYAFNFAKSFDAAGNAYRLDSSVVKTKAGTLTGRADSSPEGVL